MPSDLVTIRQIHNPLELTERDREAAQAVASGTPRPTTPAGPMPPPGCGSRLGPMRAATPLCPPARRPWPSTWATWRRKVKPLPPSSRPGLPFLTSTPPPACRRATPPRHPVVAEAVRGWRNRAPAPRQADSLTADALARVREVLRLPRHGRGGRLESSETAQRRAALDLAIIGVLADGGLRRSEAAALTWQDVELWPDGTGRLTVQKGKNRSNRQRWQ